MVNLYSNPQEDVNVGIRHIPMAVPLIGAAGAYMKELVKYPPQFKIGFMSNNPPVYDLIPKAKEAIEKLQEEIRPIHTKRLQHTERSEAAWRPLLTGSCQCPLLAQSGHSN